MLHMGFSSPYLVWVPLGLVVLVAALGVTVAGSPPVSRGGRRLWLLALFIVGSLAVAGTVYEAQIGRSSGALRPGQSADPSALAAQVKALKARLAALQKGLETRRISPKTAKHVAAFLKKSGSHRIVVSALSGDIEAYRYADRLAAVLRAANWKVLGPEKTRIFGDLRGDGVSVFSNPQHPAAAAQLLISAFKEFGIPYQPRVMPDGAVPPNEGAELFVGALPGAKLPPGPAAAQPPAQVNAPSPPAPVTAAAAPPSAAGAKPGRVTAQ